MNIYPSQNIFLNSCTGSGKTLAYLIPILNQLLIDKQNKLYYQNQHGTIILTLNKQLVLQIYCYIRSIDINNLFNTYRFGPITHYSAIIDLISQRQPSQSLIEHEMNSNIMRSIKWQSTDILITTPQILHNCLDLYKNSSLINPSYVVIDEGDLLLEIDKNVSGYTHKLIEMLKNSKYFIATSTFPLKMNKKPFQDGLKDLFPNIKIIEGINKHKVPQSIDMYYLEIKNEKQKQAKLIQLLKQKQKMVYIESRPEKSIGNLVEILHKNGINATTYHAELSANERIVALKQFHNCMISTDLGSRGLDFDIPIDLVIEYDMAKNIVDCVNRIGRTGRNGRKGNVITFVMDKDKELFQAMMKIQEYDQSFQALFSRKRSFRKLYKKQNYQNNEQTQLQEKELQKK